MNLTDDGYWYRGKLNPLLRLRCEDPNNCTVGIEVEQQEYGKVCMLRFEDLIHNETSDDADYEYSNEHMRTVKDGDAGRSVAKKQKDYTVAKRLQNLSFVRDVPSSGPQRAKMNAWPTLSMAKEDRDKKSLGQHVVRKLIQTRRVRPDAINHQLRMVTTCFADNILDETVPAQTIKATNERWKHRSDGVPDVELPMYYNLQIRA